MSFIKFPDRFLFGAATSAFQIEGSPQADGACSSNWLAWTRTPGKIKNHQNADVACDHYRRFPEDIRVMKDIGLQLYRFSLSWPRLQPAEDAWNKKGFDFYRRLLDALSKAGITPLVTLHHWDVPEWITGAWENPKIVSAIERFSQKVFQAFGDRVRLWLTLNEPSVLSHCSYLWPWFPPGRPDRQAFGKVTHHLNLAHARMVRAFRESGLPGKIGPALALGGWEPATDDPRDVLHAEHMEYLHNSVFLLPFRTKTYDPYFYTFTGLSAGNGFEEELKTLEDPGDLLGINYYSSHRIRHDPKANILELKEEIALHTPINDMNWPVHPEGFRKVLEHYGKNFGFSEVIVTENGYCHRESQRTQEELLDDDEREHFLGVHLAALHEALQAGVPLTGYCVWSLLDNFEWCHGYDPRFGIVHVDYTTQKRTVKRSGKWYAQVIRERGLDLKKLPENPGYLRFSGKV